MHNNGNQFNAKKISLSGILAALTVMTLFLATTMPTSRLSLYALSSFFVSIIIIEFGVKAGWVFYISSLLLALIVVQNKVGLIPYGLFFGVYGVAKFYIEKADNIILEYILKIVYFNIFIIVSVLLIKEFFLDSVRVDFSWWIVILGAEAIFVIYDYVYTRFIQYYNAKLRQILKI